MELVQKIDLLRFGRSFVPYAAPGGEAAGSGSGSDTQDCVAGAPKPVVTQPAALPLVPRVRTHQALLAYRKNIVCHSRNPPCNQSLLLLHTLKNVV
jgi:hypothetical protein